MVCVKYCCLKPLKSSYQTHTEDKTVLFMMYKQQPTRLKNSYNTLLSL